MGGRDQSVRAAQIDPGVAPAGRHERARSHNCWASPWTGDDSEIVAFSTRWGERYAIANSPQSGAYLRLTGDETDLARRLDGTRSVGELVIGHLGADRQLNTAEFSGLVALPA